MSAITNIVAVYCHHTQSIAFLYSPELLMQLLFMVPIEYSLKLLIQLLHSYGKVCVCILIWPTVDRNIRV